MTDWLQTGSRANGMDWVNGLYQQQARQTAGGQLAAGQTRQAANTLFRSGDLAGGQTLQTQARTAQAASRAEQLAATQQVAKALRAARDSGQDLAAAMAASRPALLALGTDAAQLAQIEQQVLANPGFLDQIEAITAEELKWELRAGGNGDTIAVRAPDRNGNTQSRVAYAAPRDPIVTPNAVITPPNRGLAAGQAPLPGQAEPAPMAGPPIGNGPLFTAPAPPTTGVPMAALPSAMVGITAQSESGNRERDPRTGRLIESPAGALGRMQVMPTTNTDPGYGVVPARDNSDEERTRVGRDYLAAMMREYGGDPAKAWAAYNWGPGNLDRALAQHGGDWLNYAPAETRAYVANNLRQLNAGQGGEIAQGDEFQDPLVPTAPRVETTADGYRIERFTNPADDLRVRADARAERREERMTAAAERASAPVRDMTAAEVASAGLPPGTVAQRRTDGTINVVSRGGDERFTEAQRKAAAFAARTANATSTLDDLAERGILRPSPQVLLGDNTITRNARGENDRRILQAFEEWLAPILRKDTGAAVTDQEFQRYTSIYLPLPTDSPALIEQKARSRAVAERALREEAGNAYRPAAAPRTPPPFEFTPAQVQASQRIVQQRQEGRRYRRGDQLNPINVNPQNERSSLANIPPGQWFITPSGERLQMPDPNPYRTQRRRR